MVKVKAEVSKPLSIEIPSLEGMPDVLTSGRLDDVVASQRAGARFKSEWEAAIQSQYACKSWQRNAIFDALIGRYTDPLKVLVYQEGVEKPRLRLVYLPDLRGCCEQGWRVLECAFNEPHKVEMATTRTNWEHEPIPIKPVYRPPPTRMIWSY
ncbi:hypothetical protein B7486_45715 [cyanobacterium TDX16]|nr:hypothetical protein B7486_45715 [cyanobacterium TDX16]